MNLLSATATDFHHRFAVAAAATNIMLKIEIIDFPSN